MPNRCTTAGPSILFAEHAPASQAATRRLSRTLAVLALGAVLLGGCRADSLVAPNPSNCTGQTGCHADPSAPADAMVLAGLSDGMLRLVPGIGSASIQSALLQALNTLNTNLADGNATNARTALAQEYSLLDPMRITIADGTRIDLPDASALRLELIPAANTLGVQAQ